MKPADVFYRSVLDSTNPRNDVNRCLRGECGFAEWRSALTMDFTKSLGGWPVQPELSVRRGEKIPKDGYTREKIYFESETGLTTPAYLLVPDGADKSTPTAVALAGHGFGVADIVGLNADGSEQGPEMNYHKKFAVGLAKRGFVTIAPELLGFGELRMERDDSLDNPGTNSCLALSSMLLMAGRTLAGARVWQARRSIDALEALGYRNDPVAMGISGGGMACTYLSAVEPRVRACCISGYSNTHRGSILAMHHCICNFQPDILKVAEMPDILSLIAPKPMLWEAGERDPIFPIQHVLKAKETVEKVYAALDAGNLFELDRFDGMHEIHGARAYDFLWEHAK